jgi:hypothetical protein
MLATDAFGTWGPGPVPEPVGWLSTWLYRWQTLLAGLFSALAVAGVTLFVWRYEHWHMKKQSAQDKRRLAKSLSREIETIVERILAAKELFDIAVPDHQSFLMPDISRPFPVYSNHTRDLALFDDETAKNLMMFYEGLPAYAELRQHFREHEANATRMSAERSLPTQEQAFFGFQKSAVPLGDEIRLRLDAIAKGQEPPPWQDNWIKQ